MNSHSKFIQRKGKQFFKNGEPYYFIGTNMWYGALIPLHKNDERGKKRLQRELDFLKSKGVNNIRALTGSEGNMEKVNGILPVHPNLQPAQGVLNEEALTGLDYFLKELKQRDMHVVLYFSNNWEWSGGWLQYLYWNGIITEEQRSKKYTDWEDYFDVACQFYQHDACKNAYWNYVTTILQRTNSITGVKYTDDPTIMAWQVANEPRVMRTHVHDAYVSFLKDTTALIKSFDHDHLVSLGVEGIKGTETLALFEQVHRDKNVDYSTIHIWPRNWFWCGQQDFENDMPDLLEKGREYIEQHLVVADALNMPLVIEEFGLGRDGTSFSPASSTILREQWYNLIYTYWKESLLTNGAVAGTNCWAFGGEAKPIEGQLFWKEGDDYTGDPTMEEQGLYTVFGSDESTWQLIKQFAALAGTQNQVVKF
jgi:mannan endo-1,4-beta-mannosidase